VLVARGASSGSLPAPPEPEALQSLGMTAGAVSQQLARLQLERPGGRTEAGGAEQSVRTVAVVRNASELADYPIPLPEGRSVRLSSIATVTDGTAEPRAAAFLDEQPVVGFSVRRTRGSSEVAVGEAVRAAVVQLQLAHPELVFTEVNSTVEEAKADLAGTLDRIGRLPPAVRDRVRGANAAELFGIDAGRARAPGARLR
jgi:multidrug efflux pump subunit AcrB